VDRWEISPGWLLIAYVVLILYGSFYPFSGWVSERDPFAFLSEGARLRISLGDVVTNVLAYVPLGFLLRRSVFGRMSPILEGAKATIAGVALSICVEMVQAYLPTRVSSLVDVMTNTLGTLIGASLATFLHSDHGLTRALRRVYQKWIVQGGVANIGVFGLALWALVQVLPLVPSLDVGKFRHALAPLARLIANPGELDRWRVLAATLSYFGMTVVARGVIRPDRPYFAAFAGLCVALLLAQIPLMSRALEGESMLGCGLGLFLAGATPRLRAQHSAHLAFFLIFAAYCVAETLAAKEGGTMPFQWVPFAVMLGNPLIGIGAILEALSLTSLLVWCLRWSAAGEAPRQLGWIGGLLAIGGAFALEYSQRHIAGRIGDITVPLIVAIAWVVLWRSPDRETVMAVPEPAREIPRSIPRFRLPAWRSSPLWPVALQIALLTMGISWITGLPGMPYNVRGLIYAGHPLRSALLLAVAVYWLFAAPVWIASWLRRRVPRATLALALPLLAVHGWLAWYVISNAVPTRPIHDIVGAPILSWPGQTETMVRYIALHSAITMHVLGGALLACCLLETRNVLPLMGWGLVYVILAPLWHWIIVTQAATDNLTELMNGGGTWEAGIFISLAALLSFASGSFLGTAILDRRRLVSLIFAAASGVAAYQLYGAGTEQALLKYGQVFSAMQFLLSPDRAHYVSGAALTLRFAVAQLALSLGIALVQVAPLRLLAGKPVATEDSGAPELV